MSHPILQKVQTFLERAGRQNVKISDGLIEEFGEACKSAIRKQFMDERGGNFRLRMSNVGKPLCQLQMEKRGAESESPSYDFKMKVLFGDLIEAAAILILKSSGIKVQSEQKSVKYKVMDGEIEGTYDIEIDNKIWDIKSASPFAFSINFSHGFHAVVEDDAFGYASQGFMYGASEGKPFGGWIVINKSTGEWCVTETPLNIKEYKNKYLSLAKDNIKAIKKNKKFKRCFTDIEEVFRKTKTGNRTLGITCSYCSFKRECWGNQIQYLPQQQSQAKDPKWVWYTKVTNPRVEYENTK